MRRLAALEHGDVVVVVVYAVAIGLVSLAVPIAAQSLVNSVAFTALTQPIVVLAALVLAGLLVAGLLRASQYRVIETLQRRFFVRATHDAVQRLAQADVRAFADRGAPELVNRFLDVAIVQKAAASLLLDGLSVVLQGAVSLLLLAFYHPALLAFDVVLLALIAFVVFGLGRRGVSTAIKESKAKYETAAWLEEMAGALRTFKATGAEELAFKRADALVRDYVEARAKHFAVLFRQIVGSYLLQALATAALLGLGGFLVTKGELTLGQLVAAELIVTGVLAGVAKFGKYLESYYDLVASVDKVGSIVDIQSERAGGVPRAASSQAAHVTLEGVGFSYDGRTDALRGVSLEITPGAQLAVLGSHTSGKSTLVDILYGVRAPTVGHVRFDGTDVKTMALADVRREVAIVGAAEIFDATVLDNLCLGHSPTDANHIAELLETVELADQIAALPDGLLTRLGQSGRRLTSSQASRLTIARGLAARPRLLVIDEALDGLGAQTARRILEGVANASHQTSVIVFTSSEEIAAAVGTKLRLDNGVMSHPAELVA